MSIEVEESQSNFLRGGGIFQMPLAQMYKDGKLSRAYEYHEYPKAITITKGPAREVQKSTETCDKRVLTWTEWVPNEETIIVHSEDEEERVLNGGMTSAALEEQRIGLLNRCRAAGIPTDPTWSAVRLRRELGEALDAPSPGDEMARMKAKLAQLEEMAAMKAKIAELEAKLSGKPADDVDELRGQLADLGIDVDMRWSVRTLRQKLDEATAPGVAA